MSRKEKIIPLKNELLKPEQSHWFANLSWKIIEPLLNPNVSSESKHNFSTLDDTLKQSSAIVVGYHPGKIEGVIVPITLRSRLKNLKHTLGPIAAYQHHTLLVRAWEYLAASFLNTHFLPVVRPDKPADIKYKKQEVIYRKSLYQHTTQQLSSPGSIYGIIPGGTRSKILLPPNQLNTSFVRNSINPGGRLPYFAMAAYKEDDSFTINLSQPIYLEDAPKINGSRSKVFQQQSVWIMRHLAALIPEEFRGPYQPIK